ncbi:MAG: valine--tRNA ligase [Thermodesulfovibrionales bacterium]
MTELGKNYTAADSERKWYDFWLERGYFTADPASGRPGFSIVIPPPNVTGTLHMGHALNATLQDILARWKRMAGFDVLWVPGMDHAGIATQNVVERQLAAEGGDRHTLGREEFIRRVWTWKAEYGGKIINQLKRIGSSCDWTRERFTLDEGLSRAVNEVFVSLYEQGLIYRDNRLINWCPRCHTALSDIEVEHEDIEGRLTYIRYPFSDGSGHVVVATTRPETMLGDTAVAVNPGDERYAGLIGREIDLPLTGRKIPLVADSTVDPGFGTGAVKVTPSHDFNDEATARRQIPQLPFVTVISQDATMTKEAGDKYAGMDRYACRKAVLHDLSEAGLLEREEKHTHAVGHCYRCKTVIEPLPTLQWYVKVQPLAEKAIAAVKDGRTKIVPASWENTYFAWMENIKDWCISRQIWWGHRIPAWYCDACGETVVSRTAPSSCTKCGKTGLRQDEDVLDTWFSSALWPFSTMGWPDRTKDLAAYYPTSVLVTGFDIIFFWVARMMMMGLHFMNDVPFRDVYIHALVRDASGQKMSKSKGNVVDPLIMMEKYGTDAFRFTLAAFAAQGRDVRFSEERVEGYRHFVNKLWNASRFILMNAQGEQIPESLAPRQLDLGSRWIVSRLAKTAREVDRSLEEYRFNDAANAVYQFIWHELCDWYIEMVKPVLYDETADRGIVRGCLLFVLERTLRLLHPFMPFVTEEIWQTMPHRGESIMTAAYPDDIPVDDAAETAMAVLMETVSGVRTIRGELNIPPGLELRVMIKTLNTEARETLASNRRYLEKLARATISEIGDSVTKPAGSSVAVRTNVEVYVPLAGLLDVDLEIERLKKEQAKVEESILFLEKKLANQDFLARAPRDVVAKEKEKHAELTDRKLRIDENMKRMSDLKDRG